MKRPTHALRRLSAFTVPPMFAPTVAPMVALTLALGTACQPRSVTPQPPSAEGVELVVDPRPRVDHINLQTAPAPGNWDGRPGSDGIEARVYLFQTDRDEPVELERGVLEFLLYEGRVEPSQLSKAKPSHLWRYPTSGLAAQRVKTLVGTGYLFRLDWSDQRPSGDVVTLSARLPGTGPTPLYAMPVAFVLEKPAPASQGAKPASPSSPASQNAAPAARDAGPTAPPGVGLKTPGPASR